MILRKIFEIIIDEFVYGGHLLGVGAISISFASAMILNIHITWEFMLIIYLGMLSIYLSYQIIDLREDIETNPQRGHHIQKKIDKIPFIIFISVIADIVILYFYRQKSTLILGLVIFLVGLLYLLVFKRLTKFIPLFKNFVAALLGILVIYFLAFYYSYPVNVALLLFLVFVFLRWLVNTIFLDIKDIKNDKKSGLKTLPILAGNDKTADVLTTLNFLSAVPILLGVSLGYLPFFSLAILLILPYSSYYINKIKLNQIGSSFLNYIFVDGEFLVWSILVTIGVIGQKIICSIL